MRRKRKASLEPQHVNEHVWYYEEPKGLLLVIECRDGEGNYIRTDQVLLKRRQLMASVQRCGWDGAGPEKEEK